MSTHQLVNQKLNVITDMVNVLGAIKNLALMQIRAVSKLSENQRQSMQTLDKIAALFLASYGPLVPASEKTVVVLFGSERGFCRDFNERIIAAYEQLCRRESNAELIVIGNRLAAKMSGRVNIKACIPGASFVEEIDSIMQQLVPLLADFYHANIVAIFHDDAANLVRILEPLAELAKARTFPEQRLYLGLSPQIFFAGLLHNYILMIMHYIFFSSFSAENLFRIGHLENAIKKMEEKRESLNRLVNRIRQEEITQEIAVIMLSLQARRDSLRPAPR